MPTGPGAVLTPGAEAAQVPSASRHAGEAASVQRPPSGAATEHPVMRGDSPEKPRADIRTYRRIGCASAPKDRDRACWRGRITSEAIGPCRAPIRAQPSTRRLRGPASRSRSGCERAFVPGADCSRAASLLGMSGCIGADAEHGVVRSDPRELCEGSPPVDRDMRPGARRDLQIAPQDRSAAA